MATVATQVDRDRLLEDGYLIIRGLIPPRQLEHLRSRFERMFERQAELAAREARPGDPPGGAWAHSSQRRVRLDRVVDESTAGVIEFLLQDETLGTSQRLLNTPGAAILVMNSLDNPTDVHGPDRWHRDLSPRWIAPLKGLQQDFLANAAFSQVQWNIALYDDDVLWVVPGSHRRPNTPEEDRALRANDRAPVPGGVPVDLKAGDGVVYINLNLHWGSNYTPKMRRTLHCVYRSFHGPLLPYYRFCDWNLDFTRHLPPSARDTFARWERWQTEEREATVATFRAIVDGDAAAFRERLARLHPGAGGRMTTVVLLCKEAERLRALKNPAHANLSPAERAAAIHVDAHSYRHLEAMASSFTDEEVATLWRRFARLDAALQRDHEETFPGFPGGPTRYAAIEMPANFEVEDVIRSWDEG